MSNAGQAALGIVGGIIGFYIGGPTGAAYGFQLGLAVGTVVSPTQLPGTFGPRMTDNRTTTSQIGQPVVEVFGTDAVSGTVMWLGNVKEIPHKTDVGGKGGPEGTNTTYSYEQSIAIGLCRGPKGGVLRIWENGKLFYDIREQLPDESQETLARRLAESAAYAEKFTLYLGTETQLPDPTIELKEGVGNVPGFRGLMYIVYDDRALRDDQARHHPNFKFEVYDGTPDCFEAPILANDVIYPWNPNAAIQIAPENALNTHRYKLIGRSNSSDPPTPFMDWRDTLADAVGDYDEMYGETLGGSAERLGWSINTVGNVDNWSSELRPQRGGGVGDRVYAWIHMQTLPAAGGSFIGYEMGAQWIQTISGDCYALIFGESLPYGGNYVWWSNTYNDYLGGGVDDPLSNQYDLGMYFWWDLDLGERWPNQQFQNNCTGGGGDPPFDPNDAQLMFVPDIIVQVQRLPQSPGPEWTYEDTKVYLALRSYDEVPDGDGVPQVVMPLNPVLLPESLNNTQAYWEAAYAQALFAGLMPEGLVYAVDYPQVQGHAWMKPREECTGAAGGIPIAVIVRAVCNRCGLSDADIDVSDLEDRYVHGYQLARVMDGRSAIAPLRSIGFFDCVDSGRVLKFPVRGKASVRTLTLEDLGAHAFDSEVPPAVTTDMQQDVELPRQLFVQFRDPARDYETNEQPSPTRLTTDAVNDVYVDVVAAIDATTALKCAEVLWAEQWAARWKHAIHLDCSQIELECTDAFLIPIDGRNERVRAVALESAAVILRSFQLVRDDDGTYVSEAIAEDPVIPPQQLEVFDTTELIILDIPALRAEDDDAGVYLAGARAGTGDKWGGASVYRSVDGDSFNEQASLTSEVVAGTLLLALPAAAPQVWDYASEIRVNIPHGEFSSRPVEDVLGGANTLAIGVHGRWELVQFANAEQVTATGWRLTTLLRGRRGTDHNIGTSVVGDRVVLLSGGGLQRLTLSLPELQKPFVYRAVTIGTALSTGTDQSFTATGEALRPFSPVHIHASRAVDGAISLEFVRRDRMLLQYVPGDPTPMSEAVEDYEIDVLDSEGTVRRVISSSTQSIIYTAAQQVTDFGALQDPVTVRIYQISVAVGRGHYREATL